jgi:hypothetical protein
MDAWDAIVAGLSGGNVSKKSHTIRGRRRIIRIVPRFEQHTLELALLSLRPRHLIPALRTTVYGVDQVINEGRDPRRQGRVAVIDSMDRLANITRLPSENLDEPSGLAVLHGHEVR